jgi:hypothetical protein
MAAAADVGQLGDVNALIAGISHWLSETTRAAEDAYLKGKSPGVR